MQLNLEVATCYPGIVRVPGEQFPPQAKKWKDVSVGRGDVKISWPLTMLEKPAFEKNKRLEEVGPEVLSKLTRKPPMRRYRLALAGIGCAGARPMVSAVTDYVKAKALFGRVYRLPRENKWGRGPAPGVYDWLDRFVPELLPGYVNADGRMDQDEWLASMPSSRRRPLSQARLLYNRTGWRHQYGRFAAFVKTELLPGFGKDSAGLVPMKFMLDRLIQGPHDVAHNIAGPWLKPKVHRLKKIWTWDNAIFYGSTGPEGLHRWLNDKLLAGDGWYFWCDFSMFDNTHSKESWAFMQRLYGDAMTDPEFVKVMQAWLNPVGRMGPFRYRARVMNASGRDDTALANGVLNGFATFLSVCAALLRKPLLALTKADVNKCRSRVVLSVTGDDSLGRVSGLRDGDVANFRKAVCNNIALFGFEAKFMMSTELSDAVYLGMRPYPVMIDGVERWFWGKTIGRSTFKMGWVTLDKERDIMAHITGVADMHRMCSSHVPVLSDLANKILQLRDGMKRTPVRLDQNKPWEWTFNSGVKYDERTLEYVARTYSVRETPHKEIEPHDVHVTAEDVKDLIHHIERIERLPCVLDHWLWKHMIWVDDL